MLEWDGTSLVTRRLRSNVLDWYNVLVPIRTATMFDWNSTQVHTLKVEVVRINLSQMAPIITKWIFAEQKGLTRAHTAGNFIRLYFERTWDNFALGYITTDTWSGKCKEFFLRNWSKFAELRLIENLPHELWHCSVPIFRSRRYRIVWVSQKKGTWT